MSDGSGSVVGVVDKPAVNLTRRQLRQQKRNEQKAHKEQMFFMSQKVTRAEFQNLINDYVKLKRDLVDYVSFVRNIFFVLEHKGVVTLDEMDKLAAQRRQESEVFKEIDGNKELSLSDKIAMAKERGLPQAYIDLLSATGKVSDGVTDVATNGQ